MTAIEETGGRPVEQAGFPKLGLCFAIVAAVFYGSIATLAKLAYDGGSDILSVAFMRYVAGTGALILMILICRRPILLPRKAWLLTLLVMLSWLIANVSFLASLRYLPVGLAAMMLYTFPFIVAVAAPLLEGGGVGARQAGALLMALAAVGLALGTAAGDLEAYGAFLAGLAAAGSAITFIVSRRLVALHDVFAVTVYVNLGGGLLLGAALFASGGIAFPYALSGWAGFVGTGTFYAVAIVAQFAAIFLAGPLRTAPVFNIEPLIAVLVAAALIGQFLNAWQWLGALLLTGSLMLLTWAPRR